MKCPACGNTELSTKIQDETLAYGGQSLTLHSMRGDFYTACGEVIGDEESYRRYTEAQAGLLMERHPDHLSELRFTG
jgi:HTH-type transcriptional regulator/antitoxin MqsA